MGPKRIISSASQATQKTLANPLARLEGSAEPYASIVIDEQPLRHLLHLDQLSVILGNTDIYLWNI